MSLCTKAYPISPISHEYGNGVVSNIFSEESHHQVQLANGQTANIMVTMIYAPLVADPQTGNVLMPQIGEPMQNIIFNQNLLQQLFAINNAQRANTVTNRIGALTIQQARLQAMSVHNIDVFQF